MRGLKHLQPEKAIVNDASHALRVRGLKQNCGDRNYLEDSSHALRVRGLKLRQRRSNIQVIIVARSTRAWIETSSVSLKMSTNVVARSTRAWIETHIS